MVVVEAARLVHGKLDDLLGARREAYFAGRGALAPADDELYGGAHFLQLNAQIGENPGGDAVGFAHKPQQDMLRADVVVVKALRLFLR